MDDLEPQLALEAAGRGRVSIAAILAGLALLAGVVYNLFAFSTLPTVGVLQGLGPALRGQVAAAIDPHTALLAFYDDHAGSLILAAVFVALGTLGTVPVLRHLYQATSFRLERARELAVAAAVAGGEEDVAARRSVRGPRLPRAALVLAVAGATVTAICLPAARVVDVLKAHAFLHHADRSHAAVNAAANSTPHLVLTTLGFTGQLALAFAFVMIPLNSMRAGLLTRFMGVLGIISGALSIIFPPLQVLEAFWLVALGLLLSGRVANPLPPAWASGKAEPWPTQQQLRERRGGPSRAPEPAVATPAPVPRAPRTAGPNASKKRKKRR
jgi:hypothetical protein